MHERAIMLAYFSKKKKRLIGSNFKTNYFNLKVMLFHIITNNIIKGFFDLFIMLSNMHMNTIYIYIPI